MALQFLIDILTGNLVLVDIPGESGPGAGVDNLLIGEAENLLIGEGEVLLI